MQHPLAGRRQPDQDGATVFLPDFADHVAALRQTIHQLNRAVVFDLQPFRQLANGRKLARRQSLDRQEELMLLRLDSLRSRGIFAVTEKPPYLMAEFRQRPVRR